MNKFKIGDKVRLTGKHLANTGQYAGPGGLSVWTVQACTCPMCSTGRFVCTDQETSNLASYTADELAAEPSLRLRHISIAAIQRVK